MIDGLSKRIAISVIQGYRYFLSPYFGQHCRFHPTCSAYAIEAIQVHGAVRGIILAARRLCRCHPLNQGGFDPVPPPSTASAQAEQNGETTSSGALR